MINQSLKNKKIIISAGASGIGWATTKICLARGAYVYLCDIDSKSLNKFKFNSLKLRYDIIFLDPPYKEKALENILNTIIENKTLKDNGIIIIHRHKKEIDKFPKNFQKSIHFKI